VTWTVNRIIHGDALDVLRELPDASVDAIITDPPYGFWRQIDVYYFPDAWYTCTCTFPYNTDEPGVCAHRPALSAIGRSFPHAASLQ